MIYVKINETLYPATIRGKTVDLDWDNRESKAITLEGTFAAIDPLFVDGVAWSIVVEEQVPVFDEEGAPVLTENGEPTYETKQTEHDNSAFRIRGDLSVHVEGTCTVKMGKPTNEELLGEQLAAAEAAMREGVNSINE